MSYKQLAEPNVDITEKAGLCLQFSRRGFGATKIEDTAYDAFQNTQFKHFDRNFPEGVSFPVWFEWWGSIKWSDGVTRTQRYDHVAIRHKDGKIYSSPLTGVGRSVFNSVDELARAFGAGMKFYAWTEDISNVRVIEEEEMRKFNEGDRENKNTAFYGEDLGRFKFAVGMEYDLADYAIMKSDEFLEHALINKGDIENIQTKLGVKISDGFIKRPAKSLLYGLTLPSGAVANPQDVADAANLRTIKGALGIK